MSLRPALRRWSARLTRALRRRIWLVLAIVLAGLVVLALIGQSVRNRLEEARTAQSENATWLVAQAEVETLKLILALDRVAPDHGPEAEAELRQAFDIYLSRVEVMDSYMAGFAVLAPLRDGEHWQQVRQGTRDLQQLLDGSTLLPTARLAEAQRTALSLRKPMRAFTTDALAALVAAGIQGRETLATLLSRGAEIGFALIALLTLTVWVTTRLSRRLRLRSREAVRARANLERTLAASLDGVVVLRPDGSIVDANPAALALFGMTRTALIGTDFRHLVPGGSATLGGMLLRGAATSPRIELTAQRPNGQRLPVELSLTAGDDAQGRPVRFAFLRDISERRSHEASLRAARDAALQAAEAKQRFLAVMSHEMRTPLNGVIAALDILLRTTRPDPRQLQFLEIAERSANMALEQINDVLDQARLDERAAPEEAVALNVTTLLSDMAGQVLPLAEAAGNRLTLSLPPPDQAWVRAPRRALMRVLLNLAGNAAKFTRGGEIHIAARLEPDGAQQGQHLLSVEVADTGIGIAPDRLEAIFEPFERGENGYDRDTEGTGLGLGIARRTVEAMGGRIEVSSQRGEGSSFRILLPVAAAQAPLPESRSDLLPELPMAGQEVLIAEDNPTNRLVLREMLRHLGQSVTEAADGAEAILAANAKAFALILMDISMPRVDGLTATQAIRSGRGPSAGARIVALTAHGLPEELERFHAGGLTEILPKPVTLARLRPILASLPEPVLDPAVLNELRALLPAAHLARTAAGLEAEAKAVLADLAGLPLAEGLAERLHRLQGACAMLGLRRLVQALRGAEAHLAETGACPPEATAALAALWEEAAQALATATGPQDGSAAE
ncbi:MAG: response regulator [Gemmobacter sp.]|uniref:hybrid sensor histidine kinase/response regulator n=1 Tax=Gemmobacter sp. TaxID=1898957 RepID=UPI001A54BA19|nr:PAS domain-containing hybrid sensor histidine kinase/response regulator [Gemmobacter sp.]MBL8562924.1 response regulator [Gemmobacter sp.]